MPVKLCPPKKRERQTESRAVIAHNNGSQMPVTNKPDSVSVIGKNEVCVRRFRRVKASQRRVGRREAEPAQQRQRPAGQLLHPEIQTLFHPEYGHLRSASSFFSKSYGAGCLPVIQKGYHRNRALFLLYLCSLAPSHRGIHRVQSIAARWILFSDF